MNNKTTATPLADLLTAFETDYINGNNNSPALVPLATMIAYSVLNKCIDPARKNGNKPLEKGKNIMKMHDSSTALLELKRDIMRDSKALETFTTATTTAVKGGFDKNGNYTPVIVDPSLLPALDVLDGEIIGDGYDLVNTAVVALLEVSAKYSDGGAGYMTRPVTVRKLSKKVLIQSADSAHFKDVETTPIQEVYKTVRRAIADSRATATDPRNGYTYIEDMAADPETGDIETVYIRQGKYADLGGAVCDFNGAETAYTAEKQTIDDYNNTLAALNLTARQATIVNLRMQGSGAAAIASYLGISEGNVYNTLKRLRDKCEKIGFTPAMWAEMNA